MKRTINLISELIALATRQSRALGTIQHSENCEDCQRIVEIAQGDYSRTVNKILRDDTSTKEEA